MSGQVGIIKHHNYRNPFGLHTSRSIAIRIQSNLEQVLHEYEMIYDVISDIGCTSQNRILDIIPANISFNAPNRIFSFDESELNNDGDNAN